MIFKGGLTPLIRRLGNKLTKRLRGDYMTTWVQDPITHKLILKEEYHSRDKGGLYIHGNIDPFISPITKEVISDRRQLREHMKEHGVTNSADYSKDFMRKRSTERTNEMVGKTEAARAERRELINRELRKYGI